MGTWSYPYTKAQILKTKDIPDFPHYAVMIFKDLRYTTPGYDSRDPDVSHTVRTFEYYAFAEGDKAEWEKMIRDYYTEKTNSKATYFSHDENEDFAFFRSEGRGKVSINIDVKVSK